MEIRIFGVPVVIDLSVSDDLSEALLGDAAVSTLQDLYEDYEDEEDEEGVKAIGSLLVDYGVRPGDGEWIYEDDDQC